MKKLVLVLFVSVVFHHIGSSQDIVTPATPGFDVVRSGIAHGEIDTITYASKTVGTNRRAIIYTPPGYTKKINTRFYTCCMALGATKRNGLMAASHR